jgi:hypothetical protein
MYKLDNGNANAAASLVGFNGDGEHELTLVSLPLRF